MAVIGFYPETQTRCDNRGEYNNVWSLPNAKKKFEGEQEDAINNFRRLISLFPIEEGEYFELDDGVVRFEWQAQQICLIVDPEPTGRCGVFMRDLEGKVYDEDSLGTWSPRMIEIVVKFATDLIKLKAEYASK